MPFVDTCTGCGRFRSVDILGWGTPGEFPLCQPCKEIYQEVGRDLIELWARTGAPGRRDQVYEHRVVSALQAAGVECRYADEAPDTRYLPEYRAAMAAIAAVLAQQEAFAALDAADQAAADALDWHEPEAEGRQAAP